MKDPLADDESKKDFLTEAGQKDFARLKKNLEDPKVAVGDLVTNLEPTEIDSDLYIYTSASKHFTFLDPLSQTETTYENHVQVVFKLVDGQWKIHKLGV